MNDEYDSYPFRQSQSTYPTKFIGSCCNFSWPSYWAQWNRRVRDVFYLKILSWVGVCSQSFLSMPNYYSDRTSLVEVQQERPHSNRNRGQKCKRTQNDNAPCDNSSIFSYHFSFVCLHLCRPGELEIFVMTASYSRYSTQDMIHLIEFIPFWHVFPNWQFSHFQLLCMDYWILVRWHWRWTIAMTHSVMFVYVLLFYHHFFWQRENHCVWEIVAAKGY